MRKVLKTLFASICTGALALSLASCDEGASAAKVYAKEGAKNIAVLKFGQHTSLDEIEGEINKTLREGLGTDYTVRNYDCNFQMDLIGDTIDSLDKDNLACVVCIATPTAVVAANKFDDIPIVFSAVSDPEGSGVMAANVTGTSDAMQLDKLVDLAKEVNPSIKNIGYIYTGEESNSISNKNKLEKIASDQNLNLVTRTIKNSSEITEVFTAVKGSVDAFIVSDDNNVASAMDTFSSLCRENNIPMYCAADSEVKDGGMMGYSISYSLLGTYTGEQVIEIVKDKKAVSDVPVRYFDKASDLNLFYNSYFLDVAKNINVPASLLAKATDLYVA